MGTVQKRFLGKQNLTFFLIRLLEVYYCILAHLIYNILSQKKGVLLGFKSRV